MLKFLIGRAGSGKSAAVYTRIHALAEADTPVMLLVPEQFTMENEREMLRFLGNRLAPRVQVLNFSRLSEYVFRETGGLAKNYLDGGGKCILMRTALDGTSGRLRRYG